MQTGTRQGRQGPSSPPGCYGPCQGGTQPMQTHTLLIVQGMCFRSVLHTQKNINKGEETLWLPATLASSFCGCGRGHSLGKGNSGRVSPSLRITAPSGTPNTSAHSLPAIRQRPVGRGFRLQESNARPETRSRIPRVHQQEWKTVL